MIRNLFNKTISLSLRVLDHSNANNVPIPDKIVLKTDCVTLYQVFTVSDYGKENYIILPSLDTYWWLTRLL